MDRIQRKLAQIDRQLAGRDFHKRIIRTCPLVFVAVGLMAGIVLEEVLGGGDGGRVPWLWAIAAGICCMSGPVLLVVRRTRWRPEVTACAASLCFVCLGAIRLISYAQPEWNDIRNCVGGEPNLAVIRGVIVTKPYVNRNSQWKFARFKPTDPSSSFYLELTEARTVSGWAQVSGTVRVQVDGPVLDLKAGDCIEAYCRLERFKPKTNPGQFDTARHLARRNVYVAASVNSRDAIELLDSPPAACFTRLRGRIRERASGALLGGLPPDEASRGLLEALLLGYRGNIDSRTYLAFRRTGLLHFVSLSGLHFGILIGIVWWVCKTAGLMKRGRAAVCIVAIAVFLTVVPGRAPTVRAAIIGWVFCASLLFRRHSNPVNSLALASIILLLIRPTQLFEAGWQLSFGTVLGILLFRERIEYSVREAVDNAADELEYRHYWRAGRMVRRAAAVATPLFWVGAAAWLGGAGIMLYHFGTITPLTSIWTVLVFPLVAAVLTLGFLKMILFFLLPTLSGILGVCAAGISELLIVVVKLIGHVDFSPLLVGHVPVWLVVGYYCFILFAFFAHLRRATVKKAICVVAAGIMVAFVGGLKWQRTHPDKLVLTCLDVSHGQAIFARLPGGGNALFDAGGE